MTYRDFSVTFSDFVFLGPVDCLQSARTPVTSTANLQVPDYFCDPPNSRSECLSMERSTVIEGLHPMGPMDAEPVNACILITSKRFEQWPAKGHQKICRVSKTHLDTTVTDMALSRVLLQALGMAATESQGWLGVKCQDGSWTKTQRALRGFCVPEQ